MVSTVVNTDYTTSGRCSSGDPVRISRRSLASKN